MPTPKRGIQLNARARRGFRVSCVLLLSERYRSPPNPPDITRYGFRRANPVLVVRFGARNIEQILHPDWVGASRIKRRRIA